MKLVYQLEGLHYLLNVMYRHFTKLHHASQLKSAFPVFT